MRHRLPYKKNYLRGLLLLLFLSLPVFANAQVITLTDSLKADSLRIKVLKAKAPVENINKQYDFGDLLRNVFNPKKKADTLHRRSGITVVPNIAANPTIGAQIGIKAVAGKKLGNDPKTLLSVAATSASITSKGIIYFYVNHNIFTPGNKWNFQGNMVVAKTVTPDYGLGIGQGIDGGSAAEKVLANPGHKGYAIHSYYYNIREKVYKEVAEGLFVGAGLSFEIRRNITNKDTTNNATPSSVYNNEHGFTQDPLRGRRFSF